MKTLSFESVVDAVEKLIIQTNYNLPDDVLHALEKSREHETSPIAMSILDSIIKNAHIASSERLPICQDTGLPIYFVTIGERARVKGDIQSSLNRATEKATKKVPLRENVVHPLTCKNPGTNVGWKMPYIVYDYKPGVDYIEITAITRGDGEDMATTTVKIPSTGPRLLNIKKGILEAIFHARWACPPHVVGVCIGANVTIANQIALKTVYRIPTGSRNPDPEVAQLEEELLDTINSLGIGPGALGGATTALALHIEVAGCHTISPALVVAPGCWTTGRFAMGRLYNDGRFESLTHPEIKVA